MEGLDGRLTIADVIVWLDRLRGSGADRQQLGQEVSDLLRDLSELTGRLCSKEGRGPGFDADVARFVHRKVELLERVEKAVEERSGGAGDPANE